MKNIRSQIRAILPLRQIVIVLTVVIIGTAISPTLKAQPLNSNFAIPNQQIVNGLFTPTNSQRFFQEGMRQFEREIDNLGESQSANSEELLKIDQGVLAPESLSPLENLQLAPDAEQLE